MSLSPDDPRPPYQQIADQLGRAIRRGELPGGSQLPSISELAERYRVSPTTVQRAVRELKNEGLAVARQGSGVFVRSSVPSMPAGSIEEQIVTLAETLSAVTADVRRLTDRVAELEALIERRPERD